MKQLVTEIEAYRMRYNPSHTVQIGNNMIFAWKYEPEGECFAYGYIIAEYDGFEPISIYNNSRVETMIEPDDNSDEVYNKLYPNFKLNNDVMGLFVKSIKI